MLMVCTRVQKRRSGDSWKVYLSPNCMGGLFHENDPSFSQSERKMFSFISAIRDDFNPTDCSLVVLDLLFSNAAL